eukprot:6462867-Amphidinium_carterae.2
MAMNTAVCCDVPSRRRCCNAGLETFKGHNPPKGLTRPRAAPHQGTLKTETQLLAGTWQQHG